jgi:hypothetical protein
MSLYWRRWWRQYASDPWNWLQCWAWKRFNVVVCRDLPPTWTDRDDLLLHASFQILKDFVEKEDRGYKDWPGHTQKSREELIKDYHVATDPAIWGADQVEISLKGSEKRADDWLEIVALYDWWEERRKLEDEDDDQYEIDNGMLTRLIAVRAYLWT